MTEPDAGPAPPPNLAEAVGWIGFELDEVNGSSVGRVRGVFADADAAEPTWLVVALARRGLLRLRRRTDLVAIPLRDCAAAAGRAWTAHGRDSIRTTPTVDPTRPLLREHELAICAHYGIGERVGRAAEVRGRPAGAVTSQPA